MRIRLLLALLLALPIAASAAPRKIDDIRTGVWADRGTCVAGVGTASQFGDGERYRVTDAATSDCAAGSGAVTCTLVCQDGAWAKLGSGAGGDHTASSVTTLTNKRIDGADNTILVHDVPSCTALTDADTIEQFELCKSTTTGQLWICSAPAAGGTSPTYCDAGGDWKRVGFNNTTSISANGISLGTNQYLTFTNSLGGLLASVDPVTGSGGSFGLYADGDPTSGVPAFYLPTSGKTAGDYTLLLDTDLDTFAEWEAMFSGAADATQFYDGVGAAKLRGAAAETNAPGTITSGDAQFYGTTAGVPRFKDDAQVDSELARKNASTALGLPYWTAGGALDFTPGWTADATTGVLTGPAIVADVDNRVGSSMLSSATVSTVTFCAPFNVYSGAIIAVNFSDAGNTTENLQGFQLDPSNSMDVYQLSVVWNGSNGGGANGWDTDETFAIGVHRCTADATGAITDCNPVDQIVFEKDATPDVTYGVDVRTAIGCNSFPCRGSVAVNGGGIDTTAGDPSEPAGGTVRDYLMVCWDTDDTYSTVEAGTAMTDWTGSVVLRVRN